ncbi:cytochrome P450 [Aspergillus japonicus CBS 114.51]|uniref:Cytochrome P450 n=1 Tax=Aspergillus japonicus CBS 114.51 TaxID=1448312 RepID=A0A8T8X9E3_ASPJA|nr:cytochrome P450 [Aspergillus japonicus CBS 114.51]RAH84620.1 cytochrome P450 [Aspergillus japonicus CBS 114.51]
MGAFFDGAAEEGISWTLIGGLPIVYLRDPVLIRQLFVQNADSISRCGSQTKGPFGTGKRIVRDALITADGEVARQWHADMLRGFHNRPPLEVFHPKLVAIARRHVQALLQAGTGDNLQLYLQNYALDTVWCLELGLENAWQYTGTPEWMAPFHQYVQMAASMSYPLQHILMNLACGKPFEAPDPRENTLHATIDRIVLQLLQDHSDLLNPEAPPPAGEEMSFLRRISKETGGTAGQPITPDVLSHARQIFSHGFPAPTLLLLWTLRELSLHPDMMQRLRAELRHNPWRHRPTPQLLSQLPYLDAVVNEVLRLYPPIPTTARAIDCAVGLKTRSGTGVVLPVDARAAVSLDMLHRDSQVWGADAEVFRPERWEGLRGHVLEGECKYLPFLTGPRRCPCSGYVMQQAKVLLAVLVLEADLEVTNVAAVRKRLGPVSEPTASLAFSVRALNCTVV